MSRTCQHVKLSDLVAKALKRNPSRISTELLTSLAKFYVQFLASDHHYLINELVDFHSTTVNPKLLVVTNVFFQTLVGESALNKTPFLRHYLLLTHYTTERVKAQTAGAPIAQFVEPTTIVALVKKPEQCVAIEEKILNIRNQLLGILERTLSEKQARLELQ
eukprot:11821077-Heterocapsa_arctica.AAC.1